MGIKALKGLTIKIGGDTSDLTKSLDKVQKQGRDLSSELSQINRLLKLDPKNTELLAQKQKVLADAISNTESKLDTLKEAEKQVQAQFARGEVSEAQYRALQREIIETEAALGKYKKAAKDTADAVEELGKESGDTADQIEEQANKTDEAEQATDDLDDSANGLAAGGLAALAAAAVATVAAIVALAEETREYRTAMGKLDTAFRDAGLGAEAATKTYQELQGILGETDQAVEAANHLAKLCDNEEELAKWTEIATGVYATFGDSLPIEGLTEAANETAKTGKLTGGLADALNWAGISEEEFQASLDKCSTEQERQNKITSTLTRAYSNAARQYQVTNKEVIRANKANEKWNATLAKIGKTVEPVVTDIKELGTAVLDDASEPLEDLAEFIRKDVLPAIEKIGKWVKKNLPTIEAGLKGVAAAMIAYKVATVAATVAQNGLKGAIVATTIAQKALNMAQKATPWGLIATAVTALTAALVALGVSMLDAKKPADQLTDAERELMEAADDAAAAFRDQKKATDEALGNAVAESHHVQKLADELRNLADNSGYVARKDKERAQLILNELNEALGTEYSMTGDLIRNYQHLKRSVDELIQSKLANSLLETANADYVAAIQAEADALENLNLKEKDYQQQLEITEQKEAEYLRAKEAYESAKANCVTEADWRAIASQAEWVLKLQSSWETEKAELDEKKSAYDQAAQDYGLYYNTVATYEEAQAAALAGNYQKAVDLLTRKAGAFGNYSDAVDEETAKVLDTLYKEAIDAGLEAERTKKNFENGVDGYTEQMVKEAEENYQKALKEFETAYADAEGVGEDITEGMTVGAENKRPSLLSKARSLVEGFLNAAREAADSHSPSRKAIKIFEDIGEGAEIGVENKTGDVAAAGHRQATALLDAYSEQEAAGQQALRRIAEQQAAASNSHSIQAASTTAPLLEKILDAIEKGQVLTIDGDTLVGATADRMDTALGRRRVLATRGAI